jgi:hypothetical protein
MDITMVIFLVFLRYKKINKIEFIGIIKKGTHLFKAIIINFPKMKKSNPNLGWLISNELLNFAHVFLSHLQNSWIWIFIL